MKNLKKVAILGAGYMGQNHARVLSGLAGVKVVAICDIDLKKATDVAKQYKIKPYENIHKLLTNENLDAVFICLPTTLHFEAARLALKREIPTFIEKPICSTVQQARRLLNLLKDKKVPLMVGHIERFNPVVNEIKQRIKVGELGKIIKIHTQRLSPPPDRGQDVSAIVDLATHDIDIIHYLIEEKKPD